MKSDRVLSKDKVFKILEIEGSLTQADIARKTGLAPATVNYTVNALKNEGLAESEWINGRQALVSLVTNKGCILSLSISSKVIEGILFHFGEKKKYDFKIQNLGQAEEEVVEELVLWLKNCQLSETDSSLLGVSLSIRAPFNIIKNDIAPWAKGLLLNLDLEEFKAQIKERLNSVVIIENDGNLGALSEWMWGEYSESRVSNFVYLTCADHVGGGIVINGQLYRGVDGMAGELGHIFAAPNGRICICGGRGCLSSFASEKALIDRVSHLCVNVRSSEDVIALAKDGNFLCRSALHDTGYAIGLVIANIYRMISPQVVCLGGYLVSGQEFILPGIKSAFEERGMPSSYDDVDIKFSQFGQDAAILGGIAQVLSSRDQSLTKLHSWM
ncbi:transcriptional regulator [Vibrio cholerae]|uniref:ROK family transcriptional regulator n=1 Tax=Vibrio cholerae TaxID=666 RepID=UPI0011D81390|nr:ROK family transcriptional regulator [Vibrio cholerae]TXX90531.1 ROK family transcriptional regulator [Vibrio cholerae]GHW45600.1 transcriptional regulator [Vibrio cholerae]